MSDEQDSNTLEGVWIPMALVDIPPHARVHDAEMIDSLAQDIAKHGLLQAIVVSREGSRYEVIAGAGRTAACQRLGWEKIRCDAKVGLSKSQKLMITLAENEEREAMTPLYTAKLYQLMMEEEKLDQNNLADKLGKDKSVISRYLSLRHLSVAVQDKLHQYNLGLRHCLLIAKADPNIQISLAEECQREGYSVRELTARLEKIIQNSDAGEEKAISEKKSDVRWKGQTIVIQRPFNPQEESKESYLAWLSARLDELIQARPEKKASRKEMSSSNDRRGTAVTV